MKITKREILLVIVIIVLLVWNAYTWYNNNPSRQGNKPGWQTGELISRKTITVPCPPNGFIVIDPDKWNPPVPKESKSKIVERIITKEIPKEIEKIIIKKEYPDWFDPDRTAILSDAKIPSWKGETYIVSTVDLTSGRGEIKYHQLPRSLWGFENETRIALGYIFIGDDAGKLILSGQYTPFRMGNWYLNGIAQAIGSRTNAGVTIEYRW